MYGFLNFSIFKAKLLKVKLVFLERAEDFNYVLVHLPWKSLFVETFAFDEAVNYAGELVKPVFVQCGRLVAIALHGIHSRIGVLVRLEPLIQHRLDSWLFTTSLEELLQDEFLFSDKVT